MINPIELSAIYQRLSTVKLTSLFDAQILKNQLKGTVKCICRLFSQKIFQFLDISVIKEILLLKNSDDPARIATSQTIKMKFKDHRAFKYYLACRTRQTQLIRGLT